VSDRFCPPFFLFWSFLFWSLVVVAATRFFRFLRCSPTISQLPLFFSPPASPSSSVHCTFADVLFLFQCQPLFFSLFIRALPPAVLFVISGFWFSTVLFFRRARMLFTPKYCPFFFDMLFSYHWFDNPPALCFPHVKTSSMAPPPPGVTP